MNELTPDELDCLIEISSREILCIEKFNRSLREDWPNEVRVRELNLLKKGKLKSILLKLAQQTKPSYDMNKSTSKSKSKSKSRTKPAPKPTFTTADLVCRPGKGCSNTAIEFSVQDTGDNCISTEDVGALTITVRSKLDAAVFTEIRVNDVYKEDLLKIADIFQKLASLYED